MEYCLGNRVLISEMEEAPATPSIYQISNRGGTDGLISAAIDDGDLKH